MARFTTVKKVAWIAGVVALLAAAVATLLPFYAAYVSIPRSTLDVVAARVKSLPAGLTEDQAWRIIDADGILRYRPYYGTGNGPLDRHLNVRNLEPGCSLVMIVDYTGDRHRLISAEMVGPACPK
jgi:hypothetical protein